MMIGARPRLSVGPLGRSGGGDFRVKSVLKLLQFRDQAAQLADVSTEFRPHISDFFTQLLKVKGNRIFWRPSHPNDTRFSRREAASDKMRHAPAWVDSIVIGF